MAATTKNRKRKRKPSSRKAAAKAEKTISPELVERLLDDLQTGLAGLDRKGRLTLANRSFFARAANSGLLGDVSAEEARATFAKGDPHDLAPALADPPETVTGRNGQIYRIVHVVHDEGPLAASIQIQAPFTLRDESEKRAGGLVSLARGAGGPNGGLAHEFAHEARTLLTNMQGFSELMLTDNKVMAAAPHFAEWAGFIRDSAATMLEELNDMVELLQILSDADEGERRKVNLTAALPEWFRAASESGAARLRLPEEDVPVACEKYMLRRALRLAQAAVAPPPPGHVEISLERDGAEALIRFAARPTQATEEKAPDAEGAQAAPMAPMGIFGLPLARAIIANHGGRMRFAEDAEGMASYNLRLPIYYD